MRAGTRILLVEDDRSIASFVKPELEHLGFRVRCAYDGPSGLEEVRTFRPELIVLDIMLPKLDGVGVLRKLRGEGGRTRDRPDRPRVRTPQVHGTQPPPSPLARVSTLSRVGPRAQRHYQP